MTLHRTAILGFIACASLAATTAFAKPHGNPHGNPHNRHEDNNTLHAVISVADQTVIKHYLSDHYRPHCPPGLAKKHNGCLPPGIAKKYAMGQPLPPGIEAKRAPSDLLSQLSHIDGYEYRQVDNDIVLVSEATQDIVDAVTLLSALGK